MEIRQNCHVELDFEILDDEGTVVETSDDAGPLDFVQGSDDIPPALAEAIEGKSPGDEIEVSFGPGEAFGPYDPEGIVSVPRDEFPEDAQLEQGVWVTVTVEHEDDSDADELEMRVVEIDGDAVVLDANHPLAQEAVTFRVTVKSVDQ